MGQSGDAADSGCRLCERSGPSMRSVFERAPEGQQILHLIRDCLRILIYRTDPLPKQVCEGCYDSLVSFSAFKRTSLETLGRQKSRLQENSSDGNISVQLFLNALDQGHCELNDKCNLTNHNDASDSNESELCAQLQKAIQDSMRKNKLQQNRLDQQQKLTNGHLESPDDDSQNGKESRDSPFSLSHNAESRSDMDQCDSDHEYTPKIMTKTIRGKRMRSDSHSDGPVHKRRRFYGPDSLMRQRRDRYMKLLPEEQFRTRVSVRYHPLSLMRCVLNAINRRNVPGYQCEDFEKQVINDYELIRGNQAESFVLQEENICNYCENVFLDVQSLAVHECNHMYVVLGEKVDMPRLWNNKEKDAFVRNVWYSSINDDYTPTKKERPVYNFDDSTGRVNVLDPEDVLFKDIDDGDYNDMSSRDAMKSEVVLIDTQATVNGVLLADMSKDERRTLYKNVTVNGVKRKFCPLCRYTFKDNWAIESHYFSTACHYTCRFCGVRFNKQRTEFDTHIKQHIMAGDAHTTKIFASRKFHSVPRVINANKVKARPPPTPRTPYVPRVRPIKMKHLLEKRPLPPPLPVPPVQIKKERPDSPVPGQEGIRTDGKQNQAYFCRKCYQVFFKLDEFNVHVVSCKGTAFAESRRANAARQPLSRITTSEPEKFSPTGRPMRNCVREIGTYADDLDDLDVQTQIRKIPIIKSSRGYECGMCSSCFPTVHSRNSHMRIHKAALHALSQKSISITRNRQENLARKMVTMVDRRGNAPSYGKYMNNVKIKEEPMEPIVEIHEQNSYSNSVGSVSITPLPNSSQRPTTLDPNIMKLVQNNPNLTIKTLADQQNRNSTPNNLPMVESDVKCYRCLSCSKPFANKSNLYFHKKNQCSGSKYPCPFCKKRFGTEAAYSSHIFYNHPE